MKSAIWIVDFGSQYTQLITRKFRELGYTSEIITVEDGIERLKSHKPKAIVLSGGPQSVFEDNTEKTPILTRRFIVFEEILLPNPEFQIPVGFKFNSSHILNSLSISASNLRCVNGCSEVI